MKVIKSLRIYLENNVLHLRVLKFAVVGLSGVLINMSALFFFTEILKITYWISSIIAIEISIISNFVLNDLWTWKDRLKKKLLHRFIQYHISVGLTAIVFNWLLLVILTEFFGMYYLLSNLIGIIVGTVSNYILNDLWTFGKISE
jgi:dolichol-phosphate mannosyltransferase